MKIIIFGASGKVGSELVKVLLDRGHEITVFVHSSGSFVETEQLHIKRGDIHDAASVKNAIKNQEVVVSTLGSWGTKTKDIVSVATKNIIPIMEKIGIKRFVSLTGAGAQLPQEKLPLLYSLNHMAISLCANKILKDSETHMKMLHYSTLDWTVIRSPVMTSTDTAKYRLSNTPSVPWALISRHAVVLAMLYVIENNTEIRRAPYVTSK